MKLPARLEPAPSEPMDPELSVMRRCDIIGGYLILALIAISVTAAVAVPFFTDYTFYEAMPIAASPFLIVGAASYIFEKRFLEAIAIIVICALFCLLDPMLVAPVLHLLVCAGGVAITVGIIQRLLFYRIIRSVEQVNSKRSLSLFDRAVVFLFNIPCDLDTRNLVMDGNLRRSRMPWRDMFQTMMLALCLCVFLWMYMFLNPAFSVDTPGALLHTFTIILYIQALVMPLTIFSSLNVRIETEYRDFRLYSGLMETSKRFFLPAMLALLFLAVAFFSGTQTLYYVSMSIVMIVLTCVFTSVVYYTRNEAAVLNDITSKWKRFHPADMYAGYGEGRASSDETVPGTPVRDPKSCFLDADQKY